MSIIKLVLLKTWLVAYAQVRNSHSCFISIFSQCWQISHSYITKPKILLLFSECAFAFKQGTLECDRFFFILIACIRSKLRFIRPPFFKIILFSFFVFYKHYRHHSRHCLCRAHSFSPSLILIHLFFGGRCPSFLGCWFGSLHDFQTD